MSWPDMQIGRDLIALTKPRLALLVIFTTAVGIAVAPGELSARQAAEAILWTTLTVCAGTTLNMALEVEPDRRMRRTCNRPLAAGRLAPRVAWWMGTGFAVLALPMLALRVNVLTAAFGLMALVVYLGIYTPLKSRSVAAVYVGAIPGATPILMGWTAATGRLDLSGLALFAILFLWQIPHFIAISLFRREEYAAAGFKILPLEYGDRASLWHMLGTTIGLAVATSLPRVFDIGGLWYALTATTLACAAIFGTIYGMTPHAHVRWARHYFLSTLLYLPLLLGMLVLDRL